MWTMNYHVLLVVILSVMTLPASSGAARDEACVSASCHPALTAIARPHQPVTAGECLACHERKVAQHPLPGGKSVALLATDEKLCAPCHDVLGKMQVIHG